MIFSSFLSGGLVWSWLSLGWFTSSSVALFALAPEDPQAATAVYGFTQQEDFDMRCSV